MQFEKSETFLNLARSFAGECQAGMRYQMIAKLAMEEKLKTLSDAIRVIAKNETAHATQFFNKIIDNAGSKENVNLKDAGYPFHIGTLAESLKMAANDEKSESEDVYPAFAVTAEQEGFKDVARLYKQIAEVEAQHRIVFEYLHEAVKNGALYKCDRPLIWICSQCGYMHVGTEAWHICPLCKAEQGYVDLHLPFEGVRE
ncbi:MAG: rubrerythrin family protein [Clostridia bacterium]|nr:rubrerythrin family protein [Clostridia bacterium]